MPPELEKQVEDRREERSWYDSILGLGYRSLPPKG